jgi:glycosyltransferase involved in cell wall biosynthesis
VSTLAPPAAAVRLPRVVVIGPLPPPFHGGAVATSYVLGSELAHAATVLHLDTTDRRGLDNIGALDVGNVLLALRHFAGMLRLLLRRPEVVYVPLAQNTLGALRDTLFLAPALLSGARVVVHLHGGGFGDFHAAAPAPLRLLLRLLLARVDRVIVLAEGLRGVVNGLVPASRVAVLPNGIPDMFGPPPDRRGRRGPVRVLYLGNLMRAKGFLDVMSAVLRLREQGLALELDLAGAWGGEQDRMAAVPLLERLGGAARVHGPVSGSAKLDLFRAADLFAFPSYSEGHPYVVLEAMAAGLPVVATSLPGISETVRDGVTGRLVGPGAVADLADALHALVADEALRTDWGAAGRARFEECFVLGHWSSGLRRIILEDAA